MSCYESQEQLRCVCRRARAGLCVELLQVWSVDQTTSTSASGRLVKNAEPEVPLQTCRIECSPYRVLQVIHARVHSVVQTLARQGREGQSVLQRETGPGGGASSRLCDSPRYPPPALLLGSQQWLLFHLPLFQGLSC